MRVSCGGLTASGTVDFAERIFVSDIVAREASYRLNGKSITSLREPNISREAG
jgi:hypothetical protein